MLQSIPALSARFATLPKEPRTREVERYKAALLEATRASIEAARKRKRDEGERNDFCAEVFDEATQPDEWLKSLLMLRLPVYNAITMQAVRPSDLVVLSDKHCYSKEDMFESLVRAERDAYADEYGGERRWLSPYRAALTADDARAVGAEPSLFALLGATHHMPMLFKDDSYAEFTYRTAKPAFGKGRSMVLGEIGHTARFKFSDGAGDVRRVRDHVVFRARDGGDGAYHFAQVLNGSHKLPIRSRAQFGPTDGTMLSLERLIERWKDNDQDKIIEQQNLVRNSRQIYAGVLGELDVVVQVLTNGAIFVLESIKYAKGNGIRVEGTSEVFKSIDNMRVLGYEEDTQEAVGDVARLMFTFRDEKAYRTHVCHLDLVVRKNREIEVGSLKKMFPIVDQNGAKIGCEVVAYAALRTQPNEYAFVVLRPQRIGEYYYELHLVLFPQRPTIPFKRIYPEYGDGFTATAEALRKACHVYYDSSDFVHVFVGVYDTYIFTDLPKPSSVRETYFTVAESGPAKYRARSDNVFDANTYVRIPRPFVDSVVERVRSLARAKNVVAWVLEREPRALYCALVNPAQTQQNVLCFARMGAEIKQIHFSDTRTDARGNTAVEVDALVAGNYEKNYVFLVQVILAFYAV